MNGNITTKSLKLLKIPTFKNLSGASNRLYKAIMTVIKLSCFIFSISLLVLGIKHAVKHNCLTSKNRLKIFSLGFKVRPSPSKKYALYASINAL